MQTKWDRLKLARFAVLGRVGMDIYAEPQGTRVQDADSFRAAIGGSAGNIAVALARQGAAAALISRLSADAVGQFCRQRLLGYGVDCSMIGLSAGETRTSLAVTETTPTDTQTVIYRNEAADFALQASDLALADFAGIGALVVTGTALAKEPSRAAAWAALHKAKAEGALVVLDIDHRAYSWASAHETQTICTEFARACDVVIGNDEEFGLLAGDHAQGPALASALATGALFTVYKRGANGALTFQGGGSFVSGIYRVDARKPMGAGDGFMGGLLAALGRAEPLEQALRCGAATAAMIVAGFGCAPASPSLPDLSAFMNRTKETPCT